MVIVSLVAGVTAALHHGRWPDHAVRLAATVVASVPSFWLGLLLIGTFAVNVHWFPSLGAEGPASLVLPSLTLGLGLAASQSRLLRACLLQVTGEPFVLTQMFRPRMHNKGLYIKIWLLGIAINSPT